MVSLKEKISLLRRRRFQRLEDQSLWPTWKNLSYLRRFFYRQRHLLLFCLGFILFQGLLEVALILISHRYLQAAASAGMAVNNQALFWLLFIVAFFYLAVAYSAIKSERTLIVRLINDLRARWFKLFLNKRPLEYNLEQKGALLAKISYHLPLLSMGLSNSLVGLIRCLLFVVILIFLAFIFGFKLLLFAGMAILVGTLVGFGAFLISYHYVSRETTFYSQIIRLIDLNLSDWRFVKTFRQEAAVQREFKELVDFDSYFRVRRDLWLKFSASLIFVLLIFVSFASGIWGGRLEYFLGSASLDTRFILIVSLIYFSRLLYESLRVGLYFVPLSLGLALSIPVFSPRELGSEKKLDVQRLIFTSAKTKLFRQAPSYRRFNYEFVPGGRYLILGGIRSGRTSLAKIFTGQAEYGRRAWLIKSDGQRFFYNDFFSQYAGFYYLDPKFTSVRSLLETVVGKVKTDISSQDFAKVSELVNQHSELRDVFFEREDWRLSAERLCANARGALVLQIIYCLLNKPSLIAIDNFWLEREDADNMALLKLLGRLLPDSIIVCFAGVDKDLFNYQNKYEI